MLLLAIGSVGWQRWFTVQKDPFLLAVLMIIETEVLLDRRRRCTIFIRIGIIDRS